MQSHITAAQLQTLYEVSGKINSQLHLQTLLEEIMDLAVELLQAEKGLIFFSDSDQDEVEMRVARSHNKQSMPNLIAMSRSIVLKVIENDEAIFLEKVPISDEKSVSRSVWKFQITSILCVPLRTKKTRIGAIYLDTTKKEKFFKKEDFNFLEAFANLAGIAIENAKSYAAVESLNKNLEKTVDERTRELRQKHVELNVAYQELEEAQLQLIHSEKMASLGMLVAGIVHEVNTPLGAIMSNNDIQMRGIAKLRETEVVQSTSDKNVSKTIDMMDRIANVSQTACERIMNIVKSLKTFARLDEEGMKWVDLHEEINNTLKIIQHLYEQRIEIVRDFCELPQYQCKASQLNQVFMNLFVNACHAIKGNGKIFIRTSLENDMIVIEIQDTGSGIAAEDLSKIFDPGFTTKGVGVGTGLGLPIAYKVVQDHQGQIDVESVVGEGTTFLLRLPLAIKMSGEI